MSPPALYRRYRPRRFSEVRGQDHVVRALSNAVREGRVGHAYLFSGPRGTGKTSTARVLAKVLNCANPIDGEPCCECENCLAVERGVIVDWMQELDAASNNKVEDMRQLLERVPLGTSGTSKVYILDEVHMLTAGAANALLKTLEEPPDHVVFILATTDPQKVLSTIKSRTQHFEFHLLPSDVLEEHVRWVIGDAALELGDDAVEHVVRVGGGSARDTLSALDQVSALGGVIEERAPVAAAIEAIADQATGAVLVAMAEATTVGHDPRLFAQAIISQLRDAFLSVMGAPNPHLPEGEAARADEIGRRLGPAALTRAMEVLGEALVEIRQAADPRIVVEVALVRLTRPDADRSIDAVLERLDRLERAISAGGPLPAETPAPAPAVRAAAPSGSRPADAARAEIARHRQPRGAPAPDDEPQAGSDAPVPPGPRRALGGVRKASGRQQGAPVAPPAAAPSGASDAAAAADAGSGGVATATATATATRPAAEPGAATPASAPSGETPSREELTLAWGDAVLGALPLKVRSKWRSGRFVDGGDGVARFAVPNEFQRGVCEPGRAEVAAALAAHFGRPVPVEIVIDDAEVAAPPSSDAPEPAAAAEPEEDEAVDLTELVDAPDIATGVDRLLEMFPGSELHETEEPS